MLVIPATQEAEIRSITVQSQPGQKVSETFISIDKAGVVGHDCNLSYAENGERMIKV
jgi:hypothetical protein